MVSIGFIRVASNCGPWNPDPERCKASGRQSCNHNRVYDVYEFTIHEQLMPVVTHHTTSLGPADRI